MQSCSEYLHKVLYLQLKSNHTCVGLLCKLNFLCKCNPALNICTRFCVFSRKLSKSIIRHQMFFWLFTDNSWTRWQIIGHFLIWTEDRMSTAIVFLQFLWRHLVGNDGKGSSGQIHMFKVGFHRSSRRWTLNCVLKTKSRGKSLTTKSCDCLGSFDKAAAIWNQRRNECF